MTTISIVPTPPAAPALSPRIRKLVEDPIPPTLLKLTARNLADASARVAFLTLDAYFVSFLGSDALAGVALVFPFFLNDPGDVGRRDGWRHLVGGDACSVSAGQGI